MIPIGIMAPFTTSQICTAIELGAAIRRRRKQLGLRQEDLARFVGTSRRFIYELEAGKATAELGRALEVCAALGIELTAALRGSAAASPERDG